jgi:hypothetical protein
MYEETAVEADRRPSRPDPDAGERTSGDEIAKHLRDDEWVPEVVEVLASFMPVDVPTATRMALRLGERFATEGWNVTEIYGSTSPAQDLADRFDEVESAETTWFGQTMRIGEDSARHMVMRWANRHGTSFRLSFGPYDSLDEFRLDLHVERDAPIPDESICSNLPRAVASTLYEALGRYLAVTDEPDPVEDPWLVDADEEIETINDTMVSASTPSGDLRISWLGASPGVSAEMALRHAAWVVAIADPLDERFPKILQAVRST